MNVKTTLAVATLSVLAAAVGAVQQPAQAPHPTVQFGAPKDKTAAWDKWTAGTPFICVNKDGTAATTVCYSFYIDSQAHTMTLYGTDCQDCPAATMKPITTFDSSDTTTTPLPLNDDQYATILGIGKNWHTKSLEPGRCDASAFANQVARAVGYKTPAMSSSRTPKAYVDTLKALNP